MRNALHTDRLAVLLAATLILCAASARADDTKPPSITDIKASLKGSEVKVEARITDETGVLSATCHHRGKSGKVEDSPMMKDDYDDIFKVSFPGDANTEYWLESTDLLGNGTPAGRPMTVSGKKSAAVVANDKPPPTEHRHHPGGSQRASASSKKPIIEHRKPSATLPDGQEATLRMKIHGEAPIITALLYTRPAGTLVGFKDRVPVTKVEGDSYEAKVPPALAHGTLEYLIAAKDANGHQADQGEGPPGSQSTWFSVTFKPVGSASAGASALPDQPFVFTHQPLVRAAPGKPITVRAQILPIKTSSTINSYQPDGKAELKVPDEPDPEKIVVLWRDNDSNDQATDMAIDKSGGLGGYQAELPAQNEGVIYYQIVACDGSFKCAVDTHSATKWHAVAVSSAAGGAQPLPFEHASTRAPAKLPE